MSWIDVITQDSDGRSGVSWSGGATILIDDTESITPVASNNTAHPSLARISSSTSSTERTRKF
jgi:hypothetical protein